MEVKKKFEKPQMKVVKLKPASIMSGSCTTHCGGDGCLFYDPSCTYD